MFFVLLFLPVSYLLMTGDFPGSDWFYGLDEDSTIVDILLTLAGK